MLFFFGCRELDLHKRFTPTSNVLKYRFYSSPEVSGIEKTLGAVVILLVLYCCFRLVKDNLVGFLRATSYGEPHALGVFGGVLLLIMSKSLDNFGHKLTKLGITVDRHIIDFTHGIEEIVELGIPLLFIIATMARFTLAPSARQGTLRGSTPKPRMLSLGLFGVGGSILVASALFAVLGYRPYFSSLHVPERWVLLCLASGALSGLLIGGAVGWRAPWQRSGQSWTACPLSQSHASLDFPPVAPTSRLFVADAGEGQDEGVETAPDGQPALHSPDRVCRS
jgi:hypothetical protein